MNLDVQRALFIARQPTAQKAEGGPVAQPLAPMPDYTKPDPLGLYSHAAATAAKMPMNKGTPEQIKGYLLKQGVKPDEVKHSGFDEKMAGKPAVTREQVAQHFHFHQPKLDEKVLGSPKTIGTNMRGEPIEEYTPHGTETKFPTYTLPGGVNYREALLTAPYEKKGYKSPHWDQHNVLLHRRLSDRIDPATKQKILHLEELQSDWGQQGREGGFADPKIIDAITRLRQDKQTDADLELLTNNNISTREYMDNRTPYHPLVDKTAKWLDLGLKRTLHDAAKGGYHKVVWTPGEEQAKRYDLSKHVDAITASKEGDQYHVNIKPKGATGPTSLIRKTLSHDELADHVGKEMAKKIVDDTTKAEKHTDPWIAYRDLDLKVGGEGMKAFYDKMLPQALLKLAKRHDPEAKLGEHEIQTRTPEMGRWRLEGGGLSRDALGEAQRDRLLAQHPGAHATQVEEGGKPLKQKVPSLDITPKMRASILKGQSAFAEGGAVEPAEHEDIERIAPNRRTKEQVKRLEDHKAGRHPDDGPSVPSIIHSLPRLDPQPTVSAPKLASGGKAERQIGDYTSKQAAAAPHIEGGDIVDRAFNLINDRTAKAEGGAVEEPDRFAKLCEVIEAQGKRLDELTKVLAAPQIVDRDENKLVTQIRRELKKD